MSIPQGPLIEGDAMFSDAIFNGDVDVIGSLEASLISATTLTSTVFTSAYISATTIVSTLLTSDYISATTLLTTLFNSGSGMISATTGKLGFFSVASVIQPTTAATPIAVYTAVGGTTVSTLDTFGGYTIGQVVSALKLEGLLKS